MRKIIAFFFIVLNISLMQSQTYKEFVQKADSCYRVKEYKLSFDYYEKAFNLEQKKATDLYNASCSAALLKEDKKAFEWLNLAIDNGYENITYLQNERDLEFLHVKKEWKKAIDKLQKKLDIIEVNYDKPLQKELLAIYVDDQEIRKDFMKIYIEKGSGHKLVDSIGKIMIYKDSLNLIKISKILDEKGWVGKDVVGAQANETLYLVIQHSPLQYQQKYLPMMREAVKKGNANSRNLAYLEDRIALREGKRQIYGSQIAINSITGKSHISPLQDPDNVDKRRAEVGLGPIANYAKKNGLVWDVEAYKKELPELEKTERQKK
jgi:hypothetical protein